MKVRVSQSCPTLCDPMGYTVHGILQARILEWVAFPFSGGSSQPRDRIQISHITGRFFTSWATKEAFYVIRSSNICKFDDFSVIWSSDLENVSSIISSNIFFYPFLSLPFGDSIAHIFACLRLSYNRTNDVLFFLTYVFLAFPFE